jgi:hypothetical protein
MEPLAMPPVDSGRLEPAPARLSTEATNVVHQPEQTVRWAKATIRTNAYAQLVAEGKDLEQQVSTRRQANPTAATAPTRWPIA